MSVSPSHSVPHDAAPSFDEAAGLATRLNAEIGRVIIGQERVRREILMCLFAASIIVGALTEGGPTFGSRWVDTRWTKPLLVIVCLIAFSFALNPLGFLLSSIPLMLLLLRLVDPVRWPLAVPIAVLAPLGMWWVLKRLLLIQLPSGIFEIG